MKEPAPYAVYLGHLQEGRLAYQFSPSAQRAVFFPRAVSPFDVAEHLEWMISAGHGTVYSTTVVEGRENGPYNVALIDIDEGFRLMSRVEGCPPRDVSIGMRVRLAVQRPDGDDPYPIFVAEQTA